MAEQEIIEMLVKGVQGLTLYEAQDLQQARVAAMQHSEEMVAFHATLYITVVSAYLAASYVVGATLSKTQVFIGNVFFAASALFVTWSAMSTVREYLWRTEVVGLYHLAMAEAFKRPEWIGIGQAMTDDFSQDRFYYLIGFMMYSGILASLYFMWSIRHSK